jgi:RNA polymerase sigma-70 factor, ECF subfamily
MSRAQPSSRDPESELAYERVLVGRARSGDVAAFAELYDSYLPRVYRYCRGRVGQEADAEDLAEEVFVKALQAIDAFEWRSMEGRSPFRAWLFRIAHNQVASFHRRHASRPAETDLAEWIEDERRGPLELAERKLAIEEVFAAVRELPEAQREVILLRFASDLSVAETAAALGKREGNVKVLQHKGIRRLRQLLDAPLRREERAQ